VNNGICLRLDQAAAGPPSTGGSDRANYNFVQPVKNENETPKTDFISEKSKTQDGHEPCRQMLALGLILSSAAGVLSLGGLVRLKPRNQGHRRSPTAEYAQGKDGTKLLVLRYWNTYGHNGIPSCDQGAGKGLTPAAA